MRQAAKYAFLAWFGGSTYVTLEVFWRARSHWTMFVLAAALFVLIGLLNEVWSWNLLTQAVAGALIAGNQPAGTGKEVKEFVRRTRRPAVRAGRRADAGRAGAAVRGHAGRGCGRARLRVAGRAADLCGGQRRAAV